MKGVANVDNSLWDMASPSTAAQSKVSGASDKQLKHALYREVVVADPNIHRQTAK
jgi:hypothetical protein